MKISSVKYNFCYLDHPVVIGHSGEVAHSDTPRSIF